jgi:hypothetical protein
VGIHRPTAGYVCSQCIQNRLMLIRVDIDGQLHLIFVSHQMQMPGDGVRYLGEETRYLHQLGPNRVRASPLIKFRACLYIFLSSSTTDLSSARRNSRLWNSGTALCPTLVKTSLHAYAGASASSRAGTHNLSSSTTPAARLPVRAQPSASLPLLAH